MISGWHGGKESAGCQLQGILRPVSVENKNSFKDCPSFGRKNQLFTSVEGGVIEDILMFAQAKMLCETLNR